MDAEGKRYTAIKEIVDHQKNRHTIDRYDGMIRTRSGQFWNKITTSGWELLVDYNDGSADWFKLKDLKDSNLIKLAEYAVANRISDEPSFVWCVPKIFRKRNRIIKKFKSRYWKVTHKFGVRLPHSIDKEFRVDRDTNTTFWTKAIKKEMKKVILAFELLNGLTAEEIRDGHEKRIGFQEIKRHMIFDVKIHFTRKERYVARGHTTTAPTSLTYSSVVSCDSVRIPFLLAGLHGLNLMACNIGNAYLNADCCENIWIVDGLEFPEEWQGKTLCVVQAFYGLKSSAASWRHMLSQTLIQQLGFQNTQSDPDVWISPAVLADGYEYYEMVLVYVDDILCLSHDRRSILDTIGKFCVIKDDEIVPPSQYLGANIRKIQVGNVSECWAMSVEDYVLASVDNVETMLKEDGNEGLSKSKKQWNPPMEKDYRPELDVSKELNAELASRYMQLIGVLRWADKLGRYDIAIEVSLFSQHNALPQ